VHPLERLGHAELPLAGACRVNIGDIYHGRSDPWAGIIGPTSATHPEDLERADGLHGRAGGARELVVGLLKRGKTVGVEAHGPVP
jgi:hypothetical protein